MDICRPHPTPLPKLLRSSAALAVILTAALGLIAPRASSAASNVTGNWNVTIMAQTGFRAGQSTTCLMAATQTELRFDSTLDCGINGTATLSGTVDSAGNVVGQGYVYGVPFSVRGTLSEGGDTITGTFSAADGSTGNFVATRVATPQPTAPPPLTAPPPVTTPTPPPPATEPTQPSGQLETTTPADAAADSSPTPGASPNLSAHSSPAPTPSARSSPVAVLTSGQSGSGNGLPLLPIIGAFVLALAALASGAVFRTLGARRRSS